MSWMRIITEYNNNVMTYKWKWLTLQLVCSTIAILTCHIYMSYFTCHTYLHICHTVFLEFKL